MGKIAELVDRGFQLDDLIKKSESELDEIKKKVKAHAKQYEKKEVVGEKSKAVVGPMTFRSSPPKEVYTFLKEQGREEEFWKMIKVKITDAEKALGETAFEKLSTSTTLNYHKIQFKRL